MARESSEQGNVSGPASQRARRANREGTFAEWRAEKVTVHAGKRLGFNTVIGGRTGRVQCESPQRCVRPAVAQRRERRLEYGLVAEIPPARWI